MQKVLTDNRKQMWETLGNKAMDDDILWRQEALLDPNLVEKKKSGMAS